MRAGLIGILEVISDDDYDDYHIKVEGTSISELRKVKVLASRNRVEVYSRPVFNPITYLDDDIDYLCIYFRTLKSAEAFRERYYDWLDSMED